MENEEYFLTRLDEEIAHFKTQYNEASRAFDIAKMKMEKFKAAFEGYKAAKENYLKSKE